MMHDEKIGEVPFEVDEEGGFLSFCLPHSMMIKCLIAAHGDELGRKATKALEQLAKRLELAD